MGCATRALRRQEGRARGRLEVSCGGDRDVSRETSSGSSGAGEGGLRPGLRHPGTTRRRAILHLQRTPRRALLKVTPGPGAAHAPLRQEARTSTLGGSRRTVGPWWEGGAVLVLRALSVACGHFTVPRGGSEASSGGRGRRPVGHRKGAARVQASSAVRTAHPARESGSSRGLSGIRAPLRATLRPPSCEALVGEPSTGNTGPRESSGGARQSPHGLIAAFHRD